MNFSPYPKNPTLAKFFKEIGRVDELGSGIRNTTKYAKIYSGGTPLFIEGDIFQTIIPLQNSASDQVSDQAGDHVSEFEMGYMAGLTELQRKVASFCTAPRTRVEIQHHTSIKSPRYLRENVLKPLVQKNILQLSLPDKPTSPNPKYYLNKSLIPPR